MEKIYLGADHAGFEFKERLKKFLEKKKVDYEDMGAFVLDEGDDYVDVSLKVAKKVASEGGKGILLCGTGEGMEIAANKVKGIRAVAPSDAYSAKMSREHNDANVLALRARKTSFDKIKKLAWIWLNTKFSGEERHRRRIKKISDYESEALKSSKLKISSNYENK